MHGEDLIARPEGVRIEYVDGTTAELNSLLYSGQEGDMFVWEALDPYPGRPIRDVQVDVLPAHTTIKIRGKAGATES